MPADAYALVCRTQKRVAWVVRATQESWQVGDLEERRATREQQLGKASQAWER